MKYIDAEKLKAEVKRYKNKADERLKIKGRTFSEEQKDLALQNLCGNLLYFISSLQQEQPEVDLEKEINKEISKWTCYEEIGFGARYDAKPFDGRDIEKIARHFYKLGLKARKEGNK